jgi:pimeloyl-ACP methyl ester carboxylesterase
MDYDFTLRLPLDGGQAMEYGILFGDAAAPIVLIKSGRGGNYRGYGDKYLQMAHRLRSAHGYTVVCASNPLEVELSYRTDAAVLRRVAIEQGMTEYTVYLIGASNGAYQNILLASVLPEVKRMLAINMPLMINFHRTVDALRAPDGVEKCFVYGTRDQSYPYLPHLRLKKIDHLEIVEIEGADHQFKGRLEEFIALADRIVPEGE